jgi:imidazolonepropionase-like amidohydrolase
MSNRIFRLGLTALVIGLVSAGCGQESAEPVAAAAEPSPAAAPAATTTREYNWFLEKTTPAGTTHLQRSADNRITNESFLHWNNREYTLNSELQLDENGMVVAQRITGTGPFGAPIDESFSFQDGIANWKTLGESGSRTTDQPAFYYPNETASLGALEAMVQAASKNLNGEIDLFPSGRAQVEKLVSHTVATPDGPVELWLHAISGVGFTPVYAWFDKDTTLRVVDGGWLSMLPDGWSNDILVDVNKIQNDQNALLIERIAGELAIPAPADLVFANVDVVDVVSGELLQDRHVHVAAGKIAAVSAAPLDIDGAEVIDATSKTLIPGLWDMHGHFGLSDGVLNIAGGITSVRDIGAEHAQIMQVVAKIDAGDIIGPTTYRAGFMDRAGPFASGWAAESLDDALQRVDFFADNGYLQVKLYSSIEPEWVAPIAERAHARGLRVSGHVPAFMSAEQAVNAGFDEIQHINMVFLNFLAGDREDTRKQLRFTLYGDEAGNLDLDSQEVQDFIALLRENNVAVDPTAAIFDTMLRHLPGEPDPSFAAVVEHLPPSVARRLYSPEMDIVDPADAWRRSAEAQAAMLKLLYDSGIQMVPGSDSMAAFTIHRELELYAEAGIPNAAVLKMATLDSAGLVGAADSTGSIEVGKQADLVLLDGNPLEDISAIRRGTLVMKGDTLYQPSALYQAVGVKPFLESQALGWR